MVNYVRRLKIQLLDGGFSMSFIMTKAYYDDVLYDKCLADWQRFLADKPVQHYSRQKMGKNLECMDRLGLTTEQCLGINRMPMPENRKPLKPSRLPMVRDSELPLYKLKNKFLSTPLVPRRV